eukprot:jgi/Hompol1/6798/HPOL_001202-RA
MASSSTNPAHFPLDYDLQHRNQSLEEDDAESVPLDTRKAQEDLKQLLENVQHTTDVTPIALRIKTPEGMTIDLMEHQKLGVEWMLKMERGSNAGGIFSQFVRFLDLFERPLQEAGFGFVRYDGSMSAKERDDAIKQLKRDDAVTVMLVSLKCGSVGLNLSFANRVIMLDFWWNPAIENATIDRVHRLGQKRDVIVHRLTIQGTVEDRILALQTKKQQIADSALGDDPNAAASFAKMRLDVNDLMMLFGVDE